MLRAGELCVIGAPRAVGKSWFGMNLAVQLGRGHGLLAGTLPVKRSARVLYCQGEIDEWESSCRWQRLSGETPPEGVVETFDPWRLRTVRRRSVWNAGSYEDWSDARLDPRLEATIVEHGIEVLIIDPWAVYFAGNENSNDETEAALATLRELAMRHSVAIVIFHHFGKATDAREPEDHWRGASRLADWPSTRITIQAHYSPKQAEKQGMSRMQARRYVNVSFLRRSTPTEDFAMHLNTDTGWWEPWRPPEAAAAGRKIKIGTSDVVAALEAAGGWWPSTTVAAKALGVAVNTASKLLVVAEAAQVIECFHGLRGATGWQLVDHEQSVCDLRGIE
jgi:hypothetical protein